MIRTSLSIEKVPVTWIFEYYCKLNERLHGQDVRIKSIFNPDERTASMFIYCKQGSYNYKDHSSGYGGDAVSLVMRMFNLRYDNARTRILDDYENRYEGVYEETELIEVPKFQVTSWKKRNWTEADAKYWTQFGIGSAMLERYNVAPLSDFTMTRIDESITVDGTRIYGYFRNNGELIKVYQPYKKQYKFFTVSQHIQGSDQLSYSKPTLVICSSLKDVMTLMSMELDVEAIAPSGEGIMIPRSVLSAYALKYERIVTLFDNDDAGHKAMAKYEDKYGIPGVYLKLSKDLSDSVRDFGMKKTIQCLKPLLI